MNVLTPDELAAKLGISKAAMHALRNRDQTFPPPIRLSEKVIRWDEADVDKWLETRKETDNA